MKTEIKYGFNISVAGFAFICAEFLLGLHTKFVKWHPMVSWVAMLIPVLGLIFAIRQKRYELGGFISYKKSLRTGVLVSIVSAIVNPLFIFIYYKIVNPGWTAFMVEEARKFAISSGKDPFEAMKNAEIYFSMKSYMIQSALGALGGGILISLILAYFLQKKEIKSEENQLIVE